MIYKCISSLILAYLVICLDYPNVWRTYRTGWLQINLNYIKTKLIFFIASSPYMQRLQHHTLLLGDTKIYPSYSIHNLGVIFDQHMTMSEHVTQLCRSINWQIRNIYHFRHFIDFETCHHIVRSLVLSKLDYCNVLLNGLAKKDLKRLQKLQNKCARLICQIPRSDHITPSLAQLHWLIISDRIIYKTVLHVFKSLQGLSLLYIDSCLKIRFQPSSVTTCSSNHIFLEVPRSKKLAGERAFCVSVPKLWNSLPNTIKDASSLDTFKTQLKSHLYPY